MEYEKDIKHIKHTFVRFSYLIIVSCKGLKRHSVLKTESTNYFVVIFMPSKK